MTMLQTQHMMDISIDCRHDAHRQITEANIIMTMATCIHNGLQQPYLVMHKNEDTFKFSGVVTRRSSLIFGRYILEKPDI